MTIGAGALYAPNYEGDDEYHVSVLPNVEVAYGERFSASVQNGARYRWIDGANLRAGPIARLNFGRDEDGSQAFAVSGDETDDLRGLGDIDTSIELGGFLEHELGALTLSVEARQGLSGHEGFVADLGARWSGRAAIVGQPVLWSVGPRARFVDDTYNSAFFGVTPTQSLVSGLNVYDASGGLYSYGASASLVLPLESEGRWAAVVVAGLDRLEDDAAESPLVQERGDRDQASVGVFLTRRLW
ncbi:MAG: MipA/OmpV family protein [Hyphomonadaceae bacterium]